MNKMKITQGGSKTPQSVMGSQGSPANIPVNHFQNKPVKHSSHPAGMSNSKGAKRFNHASGDN